MVRLGAKGRAAGTHLILATEYPDYKTVTRELQANLSVRVCLRTTTKLQSQVTLKREGGERLLGKGDLFYPVGDRLWRMQAPFLDEAERIRIFLGCDQASIQGYFSQNKKQILGSQSGRPVLVGFFLD